MLEFSDGMATAVRLSEAGAHWMLETEAYLTAAGTAIERKRWRIELSQDGQQIRFRVVAKAALAGQAAGP